MTIIEVNHVNMHFNMSKHRVHNLKEYVVLALKRQLVYEDFQALHDITFTIERGDVFGIVGLNGSGKSTLLKIISGILKPTTGSVKIQGTIAPLIELGAGFDLELTARENIFLNGAVLGHSPVAIDVIGVQRARPVEELRGALHRRPVLEQLEGLFPLLERPAQVDRRRPAVAEDAHGVGEAPRGVGFRIVGVEESYHQAVGRRDADRRRAAHGESPDGVGHALDAGAGVPFLRLRQPGLVQQLQCAGGEAHRRELLGGFGVVRHAANPSRVDRIAAAAPTRKGLQP